VTRVLVSQTVGKRLQALFSRAMSTQIILNRAYDFYVLFFFLFSPSLLGGISDFHRLSSRSCPLADAPRGPRLAPNIPSPRPLRPCYATRAPQHTPGSVAGQSLTLVPLLFPSPCCIPPFSAVTAHETNSTFLSMLPKAKLRYAFRSYSVSSLNFLSLFSGSLQLISRHSSFFERGLYLCSRWFVFFFLFPREGVAL